VARPSDGYHHGDLRRALLQAAFQVLDESGLDRLSLREVARRAGVSHAAPYHHFADKAALVTALVDAGFEQLAESLSAAASGPGTNLERLGRIGGAYVSFAIENPATFRLLFRPELRGTTPAAGDSGQAAYAVLLEAVRACLASREAVGDSRALSLTAWSTVHGLATLLLDGPLHDHLAPGELSDSLARNVTSVLAVGFMPRGG
jgi:AcrR family transcriptional regulator